MYCSMDVPGEPGKTSVRASLAHAILEHVPGEGGPAIVQQRASCNAVRLHVSGGVSGAANVKTFGRNVGRNAWSRHPELGGRNAFRRKHQKQTCKAIRRKRLPSDIVAGTPVREANDVSKSDEIA